MNPSDRNVKRHIGPAPTDFRAMFDLGSRNETIVPVDADGVAFAAIQELNDRVKRLAEQRRG